MYDRGFHSRKAAGTRCNSCVEKLIHEREAKPSLKHEHEGKHGSKDHDRRAPAQRPARLRMCGWGRRKRSGGAGSALCSRRLGCWHLGSRRLGSRHLNDGRLSCCLGGRRLQLSSAHRAKLTAFWLLGTTMWAKHTDPSRSPAHSPRYRYYTRCRSLPPSCDLSISACAHVRSTFGNIFSYDPPATPRISRKSQDSAPLETLVGPYAK